MIQCPAKKIIFFAQNQPKEQRRCQNEGEREYTITREEERKRELTSRERRHDLFQRLMLDDEMGVKMGEGYFE